MEQHYKKSLRFDYGKKESTIVAGIAIILMIFHHTFGFYEIQLPSIKYFEFFIYKDITLERIIASFGKICVSIFAFNSGYSFWVNRNKNDLLSIVKKLIKFMIGYWLSLIIFMLYAYITNDRLPDLSSFILNVWGLNTGSFKPFVNIAFAWYVTFYILLLLFSPLIPKIFKFNGVCCNFLILIILYYSTLYIFSKYDLSIFYMFFSTAVYSFGGYIIAKHNMFIYLNKAIGDNNFILLSLIFLCLILRPVLILVCEYFKIDIPYDLLFAPLFIYSFITLINNSKTTSIIKFFLFIGSISMYLWFFHSIFYTGKSILQPLIYFPKISILILAFELLLLIPVCLFVKYIHNEICKFLKI